MYSMKEACQEVGMTYEALKFYCNEGLVPNVKRDGNNHRVFDERDIAWIKGLTCLKNCEMSISDIKSYLALCLQGRRSISQRQDILARQKSALLAKIGELETAVAYIETKQRFYQDVLEGKTEYRSNLIPAQEYGREG